MHEIVAPNVVFVFGPKSNVTPIIQLKTAAPLLLLRDFQTLFAPDSLDPFVIYLETFPTKQSRDPTIAVTTELTRQRYNSACKFALLGQQSRRSPLNGSRLTKYLARPAFSHGKPSNHALHGVPTLRRARQFPRQASFRIAQSRLKSATSFLSLAFSFSSSRRRFA